MTKVKRVRLLYILHHSRNLFDLQRQCTYHKIYARSSAIKAKAVKLKVPSFTAVVIIFLPQIIVVTLKNYVFLIVILSIQCAKLGYYTIGITTGP